MIIEFYGTPGAGKTYLANAIVSQLESEGIHAENIVELGRSKVKNKAINKFVRIALNILPRYKKMKKDFCNVLFEYINIPAKYNNVSIECFIDNIIYYTFWYDKLLDKKGVFIFDEGIVHQYVNMMVNYDVKLNSILDINKIIPYLPNVIYVTCDNTLNFESIQTRNRHVCYIDELTGDDLKACIRGYRIGCECVGEIVTPLIINRENDVQHNVQIIRDVVGI